MKRLPILISASLAATVLGVQTTPPSKLLGTLSGFDEDGAYIAPAIGTSRIYLVNDDENELSMFDRVTKKTTSVAKGEMWGPAVSAKGDRVAFARKGEAPKGDSNDFIWTIPLDPKTGLASGPARRVSMSPGIWPAFSPDGKSIAFIGQGPTDGLTIVPATGGAERVVTRFVGGFAPIQWSLDGKFIYFGLGSNRSIFRPEHLILRTRVEDGAVDTLVRIRPPGNPNGTWFGISPDGRTLATASGARIVFSDADGKRLGDVGLPSDMWVWSWTTPTTFLTTKDVTRSWLVSVSLADGKQRVLTDTTAEAVAPIWSPDGKRIAFTQPSKRALVVLNADGSGKRTIGLHNRPTTGGEGGKSLYWSPDGRAILYAAETDGTISSNHVVDLTTGRERDVFKGGTDARVAMWMSDSKTILYTRMIDSDTGVLRRGIGRNGECVWGPCTSRQSGFHGVRLVRHEIHLVSPNGQDRVVRDIMAGCPGCVRRISDTTILFNRAAETVIASLKDAAPPRALPGDTLFNRRYGPSVSPDGQWLAFVRFAGGPAIEFVKVDGSARKIVAVPEAIVPGVGNAVFTPDSRSVLVMCRVRNGKGERSLYRVDLSSGEVTRVVTVVRPRDSTRDYAISPDGRSLLYSAVGEATAQLSEVDVSGLLSAQQQGARKR